MIRHLVAAIAALAALSAISATYKVETDKYEFHINVCGPVSVGACPSDSGASQVSRRPVTTLRSGFPSGVPCARMSSSRTGLPPANVLPRRAFKPREGLD